MIKVTLSWTCKLRYFVLVCSTDIETNRYFWSHLPNLRYTAAGSTVSIDRFAEQRRCVPAPVYPWL